MPISSIVFMGAAFQDRGSAAPAEAGAAARLNWRKWFSSCSQAQLT
jgi:hypothetical protein